MKILRGHLSSASSKPTEMEQADPPSDLIHCPPNSVFRAIQGVSQLYLTPQQKHLFFRIIQTVIHGMAGTGKTMMIWLKIIELVRMGLLGGRKVLLVVPPIHDTRSRIVLERNSVTCQQIESDKEKKRDSLKALIDNFDQLSEDVFIFTHESLVDKEVLDVLSSDKFHVFMDDTQCFGDIRYRETDMWNLR